VSPEPPGFFASGGRIKNDANAHETLFGESDRGSRGESAENPKSEVRNPKQIQINWKIRKIRTRWRRKRFMLLLNFPLSDFGFRVSDLKTDGAFQRRNAPRRFDMETTTTTTPP
jgi:hypothetical protein